VFRRLHRLALTHVEKAISDLLLGAAMRSCEYRNLQGESRTSLLQLANIKFYKSKQELSHSDPFLHLADYMRIAFPFQKADHSD
jgi:hypothetical protein